MRRCIVVAAILLLARDGRAEDRMIAGDCIGFLTQWCRSPNTRFDNRDLQNALANGNVSAIVIPWPQKGPSFQVFWLARETTTVDKRDVTQKDLKDLYDFATEKVFHLKRLQQAIRTATTPASERALANLITEGERLFSGEKTAYYQTCGAMVLDGLRRPLSELEPTRMAVKAYKDLVKVQLDDLLGKSLGKLKAGEFHVLGTKELQGLEIIAIDPKSIEKRVVKDRKVFLGWVGAKCVVTLDDTTTSKDKAKGMDDWGTWDPLDFMKSHPTHIDFDILRRRIIRPFYLRLEP